jgi:hypothetical protein
MPDFFGARLVLLATLLAAMASCNQPDFPKYTTLGDVRILTIIASAPEASPGDTVTFTPVLSDLNGNGRTLDYSISGCIDPGVSIGADPVCPQPDPGSMQTGTVSPAPGVSLTYTGPVPSFSLTMPDAGTIFAGRSSTDQYNGVAYLVFYTISAPDGPSVKSFLRVIVSAGDKPQKNQNPAISSVDLKDIPITGMFSLPGAAADFRVTFPASSAETYQSMRRDGSLTTHTEEMITTWFVSDGEFDFSRTIGASENTWTPPKAGPEGRGVVLVVVTRDERGGAAFQKIEMN